MMRFRRRAGRVRGSGEAAHFARGMSKPEVFVTACGTRVLPSRDREGAGAFAHFYTGELLSSASSFCLRRMPQR